MTFSGLAAELHISPDSLKKFVADFDLPLDQVLIDEAQVAPDFEKFAAEHQDFLQKFDSDLSTEKTPDEIAAKVSRPISEIEELIKNDTDAVLENGLYRTTASSYTMDSKLGGDYTFIYNYFGDRMPLLRKDFIGYTDLYFHLHDVLEPFLEPAEAKNWGIKKPAGIILYGPPGSGKIFWANKIANRMKFEFKSLRPHFITNDFSENFLSNFNTFLIKTIEEKKSVLFLEDFDEIMTQVPGSEDPEKILLRETILHYISKFAEADVLMIAAADNIDSIDPEITAPGRFDVAIPVFPPNARERAELLRYSMLAGLEKESTLYKILETNNADHLPFWNPIAEKMKAFSNTMVIDFTQSLKKRIRQTYSRNRSVRLNIGKGMLDASLRDASAKLTPKYLDQVASFLKDAKANNRTDFPWRIRELSKELQFYRTTEEPRRAIGFQHG